MIVQAGGSGLLINVDKSRPDTYQVFGEHLAINWQDGHESLLSFSLLRDECPCAQCKVEPDQSGRVHPPAQPRELAEQSYRLVSMQPVGHYGLQLVWGDDHSTGIYTFDYLRNLCDCDQCRAEKVSDS